MFSIKALCVFLFPRYNKRPYSFQIYGGLFLLILLLFTATCVAAETTLSLDAVFPGGNIALERVEGDFVYLKPDLRDTEGWWFYWNFRLHDISPRRTLTFDFGNPNPLGVHGPAVSTDGGRTWSMLGMEACKGSTFTYAFAENTSCRRKHQCTIRIHHSLCDIGPSRLPETIGTLFLLGGNHSWNAHGGVDGDSLF